MSTTRTPRELRAELAPILLGHVFVHASIAGSRLAAPLLILSQGYSSAVAGILVALFALTQIFLSLPAGRYADRVGLKRPMAVSVVAASAGMALAAAWPIFPVLCLSALIVGGAICLASIALQRHVGRMAQTTTELKQAFSWFSMAPAVSNFVGPLMTGLLIDYAGYRVAFAALAILPLLGWLLLRRARELPAEQAPATPSGPAWELLRDPRLRLLLFVNWFITTSWDLHIFMVPVLGHERGLPASVIGSILGAFSIAATLVRGVMPLFARGLREWVVITTATAISGLGFLIYPFAPSPLAMGACSAVLGMAFGGVQPMVMSMLHQITPRHRNGEALAVRLVMVNISAVAMPLLFGAIGGVVGVSTVFWVMGGVITLGSRLGFGLRGLESEPHGK